MKKSKNSEKGHKIQNGIFNILHLSINYYLYMEYLQSESHEYSLYEQITLRGYCTPGPLFLKTLCIFSKK